MQSILVCDDDKQIVEAIDIYLTGEGFEVIKAYDGAEALELLKTHTVNLMILDVMMPGLDGIRTTLKVRETSSIPIIILSAKSEDADKILGLNIGADDYITKPFDPSQLVARVRSHLKRYERLTTRHKEREEKENAQEQIKVEDVVIEPQTWRVWKAGEEVKLPHREFELLVFLAKNPNIVFSKEALFEKIWGFDYVSDAATVSVHINRLREKLEDDPRDPKIIETVWGAGYRLNR